jgi:hypothetical protein
MKWTFYGKIDCVHSRLTNLRAIRIRINALTRLTIVLAAGGDAERRISSSDPHAVCNDALDTRLRRI